MKKLLFSLFAISALCLGFVSCTEEVDEPGSIYGVVTDKATGEPIRSAGVELSPTGAKTITGSEGQFEFTQLNPGQYTLLITKTGYTDYASSAIQVTTGQQTKTDVQIEQLPPALKVVNDSREEISELDFGSAEADVARSFNIFNDGVESLEWEIVKTADWIKEISKTSGILQAGGTQAIIIAIDRTLLKSGENKTTVHITSNNGSKQLTVKATNGTVLATLNTLPATNIKTNTATLHGKILTRGTPTYTERGFVYATQSMPTIETTIAKLTVPVTEQDSFAITVTNLQENTTYFVRAYAINSGRVAYSSNEVQFTPVQTLAQVETNAVTDIVIKNGAATFNGKILDVGDPAYTERGFVYGLQHNPTVEDDMKKVVSGKGLGAFSSNVSDLQEGNVYYVRAFATNATGTVYGEEVECNCIATMPSVSTVKIDEIHIAQGVATFHGKINTLGDLEYEERGFVYATVHNPTYTDSIALAHGSGLGDFTVTVRKLEMGNTYYVRAFAKNHKGIVYGEELTLDFHAVMPVVTTDSLEVISTTSAVFNGTIKETGDPAYTERGFVYGTMPVPTIDNGASIATAVGTTIGKFNVDIIDLQNGKTYYVCAYAKSSAGIAYGEVKTILMEDPDYQKLATIKYGGYTYKIYTELGTMAWRYANKACQDLVYGGYSDWYLPNKDELMYIAESGLLSAETWWSSFVEDKTWYDDHRKEYYRVLYYYFIGKTSYSWYSDHVVCAYYAISDVAEYPTQEYHVCAVRKYKE